MASRPMVAKTLGALSEAFGGDVSDKKLSVYCEALSDLSDEQLVTALRTVLRTWDGKFIPPPAALRNAIGANVAQLDAEPIIERIYALREYSPTGIRWPSTPAVRDACGELVAIAYADAGGARIFADSDITRDIARREFSAALQSAMEARGVTELAMPSPRPRLSAASNTVLFDARPARTAEHRFQRITGGPDAA